ncbi:glycine-rich domain-containing protein [Kitasatospora sp. NPDC059408]|uniref:glycine-rich domain-containing protein n=1 Tax=Kitasatospora sp. NPDC059408 TaxID=3346823 RepID=UPI003696CB7C
MTTPEPALSLAPPSPGPMLPVNPGSLVATETFGAVVHTVLDNNPGMPDDAAERIVTEALKFVATARTFPTVRITPSTVVDEGWHALILHTRRYADLCARLGGFVHHYPERPDPSRHDPDALARTAALIEEAGYTPDYELWTGPTRALVAVAAQCSHTPIPGGCGPINPGGCASHCNGGGGGGGGEGS